MMPFRGLVLALLLLPGGARRLIRVEGDHRDAQQQSDAVVNDLGASVEAQEALVPGVFGAGTRRGALAKAAAAALAGAAAVQAASAKAGQFSKIEVFSLVGPPSISSPYQAGGPQAGEGATFGYAKSDGAILAKGYTEDVTRETAALEVSKKIVRSQLPNIESKTWWLVRDNFRGQAYNMKANMRAIIKVQSDGGAKAQKAYNTFWNEVNSLDLACVKKELDLAKKEYQDVLDALTAWENVV